MRNYALLFEKGLSFQALDVKQGGEGDRKAFLQTFPYGLTPGLRHGDALVWESQRINDYLEDAFPQPALLPDTPGERARARQWMHHCDHTLFPALYRNVRSNDGTSDLQSGIDQLSHPAFGGGSMSPYWGGSKLGLVDINYHLLFQSLSVSQPVDVHLPQWMQDWSAAVGKAPSIVKAREFMVSLVGRQPV